MASSFTLSSTVLTLLGDFRCASLIGNLPERFPILLVQPSKPVTLFLIHQFVVSAFVKALVNHCKKNRAVDALKEYFPPSPFIALLVSINAIKLVDGHLGFILHTITGFHRPRFIHYYGFICHLTFITTLSYLLCNDVQ